MRKHSRLGAIGRAAASAALVVATMASFLAVTASPADAAGPWFVAKNGNNAANCLSSATPCLTIAGALTKASAGDTINVANGTYAERLNITKSITIQATNTGQVTVDATATSAAQGVAVTVNSASAVVNLRGLVLTKGYSSTSNNTSGGGGGLQNLAGTTTCTFCTITANTGAYGGGVLNFTGTTNLTDSTVSSNTSPLYGGGVTNYSGTTNLLRTTVTGNTAFGGGGFTTFTGIGNITDSSFSSNTGTFGGGVLAYTGTTTVTNTLLASNLGGLGGGAMAWAGGTLNVSGGTIRANNAANGGGVYLLGKTIANNVTTPGGIGSLTGTLIEDNVAAGGSTANAGNGGGIFSSGTLTTSGVTMHRNRVTASSNAGPLKGLGGQIFTGPFDADDAPAATIGTTTIDNVNGLPANTVNAVVGGGIANAGNIIGSAGATVGTLSITGTTVSGQTALAGAGLYSGGSATITNSRISGNAASTGANGYGGGIEIAKNPASSPTPVVTLDATEVSGNSALAGGGIAALGTNVLNVVNHSVIKTNSAVSAGGLWSTATTNITDSTVQDNTASFQGGGIYNAQYPGATDLPVLTLTNSDVLHNTAANAGGGIITLTPASLATTGGSISDNVGGGGGGVYTGDGVTASFTSTDFVGNQATANYGGALFTSGTTTLTKALVKNNSAAQIGGAIYSGSNTDNAVTKLTVDASTFTGNTADNASVLVTFSGGATPTNLASINRSTITGNSTVTGFGAIENLHPISINASTITGNSSPVGGISNNPNVKTGGGLWSFAAVGLSGSVVSGNTGGNTSNANCTGGVVSGGYNHTGGEALCGHSPAKHDQSGNPVLGALASNGGDTPTQLPGATSPLINKIPVGTDTALPDAVTGTNVVLCAGGSTDQRGVARPQGATCDIGSVEADLSAPTIAGPTTSDYAVQVGHADAVFTTTGVPQPTLSLTGTLPAGLTFVDNGDGTGKITGTPTAGPGGNYVVTVKATNSEGSAQQQYTIVLHEAPALAGPTADTFTVGVNDTTDPFHQTGGFPGATLSATGTLPAGVTFVDNGDGTGVITGTAGPGTGGTYPVTITASNGTSPDATLGFTLTVAQGPTVTGPATATFQVGTSSSSGTYTTTGFPKPALSATGLPSGLTFQDNGDGTGKITGNAAAGTGGTYAVVVKATNATGSATTPVTVTVNEKPSLAGPASVRFVTNVNGSFGYTTGGFPQAALSSTGTLPTGVTFVDNGDGTATLAGTPTTPGAFSIQVTANNGISPAATLTVAIEVVPPVVITTTALPDGQVGVGYSAQLAATGGQPAYTFSLVGGSLPAGLSLAPDGTVSGTPTGPVANASFTVKVTDSLSPAQSSTKVVTLNITKGPSTVVAQSLLLSSGGSGPLGVKLTIGTANATLKGGVPGVPLAGQQIVFKVGATTVCTATTLADGSAKCVLSVTNTALAVVAGGITATYAGSALWLPSSDSAGIIG